MSSPPRKRRRGGAPGYSRAGKGGVPQDNPFINFLRKTELATVLPRRKVNVLDDTATVLDALTALSKFQILSIPVVDVRSQKFLGFVDMLDIVYFVVDMYFKEEGGKEMSNDTLYALYSKFGDKSITTIIDASHRNPVCQVTKSSPIFETVSIFQRGIHRVAVIDEQGKIINIVSQTDIIRYLLTKVDQFSTIFVKTAAELGMGSASPQTVQKDELAIHAFKKLYEQKRSAFAVVDEQGKLVGNLSASDLKGAVTTDDSEGANPFGALLLPVYEFLCQGGMSHFKEGTCTANSALYFVLLRLLSLRVHRLWIVDADKPIGLISLTDVMRALISQQQPDREQ